MDFKLSDECLAAPSPSTAAAGRRLLPCTSVNGTRTTAISPPTNPAKDNVKPGVSENAANLGLTTKSSE